MKPDTWVRDPFAYGRRRDGFRYLQVAIEAVRRHAPGGGRLLDVGGGTQRGCKYLNRLREFDRTAVELDPDRGLRLDGVRIVFGDFMYYWPPDGRYDVAMCLQVIEHVPDPAAFCGKLFASAGVVVLSVPYQWPAGMTKGHLHDPIDEAKLAGWTGRQPTAAAVVRDSRTERLVAADAG